MSDVYQYCTRCGDELSEGLKERYTEEHQGGPVLCGACLAEIIHQIPKAFQPLFRAMNEMAQEINETFTEAFKVDK